MYAISKLIVVYSFANKFIYLVVIFLVSFSNVSTSSICGNLLNNGIKVPLNTDNSSQITAETLLTKYRVVYLNSSVFTSLKSKPRLLHGLKHSDSKKYYFFQFFEKISQLVKKEKNMMAHKSALVNTILITVLGFVNSFLSQLNLPYDYAFDVGVWLVDTALIVDVGNKYLSVHKFSKNESSPTFSLEERAAAFKSIKSPWFSNSAEVNYLDLLRDFKAIGLVINQDQQQISFDGQTISFFEALEFLNNL